MVDRPPPPSGDAIRVTFGTERRLKTLGMKKYNVIQLPGHDATISYKDAAEGKHLIPISVIDSHGATRVVYVRQSGLQKVGTYVTVERTSYDYTSKESPLQGRVTRYTAPGSPSANAREIAHFMSQHYSVEGGGLVPAADIRIQSALARLSRGERLTSVELLAVYGQHFSRAMRPAAELAKLGQCMSALLRQSPDLREMVIPSDIASLINSLPQAYASTAPRTDYPFYPCEVKDLQGIQSCLSICPDGAHKESIRGLFDTMVESFSGSLDGSDAGWIEERVPTQSLSVLRSMAPNLSEDGQAHLQAAIEKIETAHARASQNRIEETFEFAYAILSESTDSAGRLENLDRAIEYFRAIESREPPAQLTHEVRDKISKLLPRLIAARQDGLIALAGQYLDDSMVEIDAFLDLYRRLGAENQTPGVISVRQNLEDKMTELAENWATQMLKSQNGASTPSSIHAVIKQALEQQKFIRSLGKYSDKIEAGINHLLMGLTQRLFVFANLTPNQGYSFLHMDLEDRRSHFLGLYKELQSLAEIIGSENPTVKQLTKIVEGQLQTNPKQFGSWGEAAVFHSLDPRFPYARGVYLQFDYDGLVAERKAAIEEGREFIPLLKDSTPRRDPRALPELPQTALYANVEPLLARFIAPPHSGRDGLNLEQFVSEMYLILDRFDTLLEGETDPAALINAREVLSNLVTQLASKLSHGDATEVLVAHHLISMTQTFLNHHNMHEAAEELGQFDQRIVQLRKSFIVFSTLNTVLDSLLKRKPPETALADNGFYVGDKTANVIDLLLMMQAHYPKYAAYNGMEPIQIQESALKLQESFNDYIIRSKERLKKEIIGGDLPDRLIALLKDLAKDTSQAPDLRDAAKEILYDSGIGPGKDGELEFVAREDGLIPPRPAPGARIRDASSTSSSPAPAPRAAAGAGGAAPASTSSSSESGSEESSVRSPPPRAPMQTGRQPFGSGTRSAFRPYSSSRAEVHSRPRETPPAAAGGAGRASTRSSSTESASSDTPTP